MSKKKLVPFESCELTDIPVGKSLMLYFLKSGPGSGYTQVGGIYRISRTGLRTFKKDGQNLSENLLKGKWVYVPQPTNLNLKTEMDRLRALKYAEDDASRPFLQDSPSSGAIPIPMGYSVANTIRELRTELSASFRFEDKDA